MSNRGKPDKPRWHAPSYRAAKPDNAPPPVFSYRERMNIGLILMAAAVVLVVVGAVWWVLTL